MSPTPEARFERWFERFGAPLRRLALAYTRDPTDAEDLLQDIWLGIWRALPGFRGECSDRTFVYRIGHNRGLTFRSRRRSLAQFAEVPDLADSAAGPDTLAERATQRERLLAAVRDLPASLRQVVVLHLEGLGNVEITQVTGLSESNVGVRLSRARARLRGVLQKEVAG